LQTCSLYYNLLNLHAHGTESVEWEKRIIENSERSSRGAWATAPTLETAMSKAAAFAALPSVAAVESVATLVPGGQEERLVLVRAFQPVVGVFPAILPAPIAVSVPDLQSALKSL